MAVIKGIAGGLDLGFTPFSYDLSSLLPEGGGAGLYETVTAPFVPDLGGGTGKVTIKPGTVPPALQGGVDAATGTAAQTGQATTTLDTSSTNLPVGAGDYYEAINPYGKLYTGPDTNSGRSGGNPVIAGQSDPKAAAGAQQAGTLNWLATLTGDWIVRLGVIILGVILVGVAAYQFAKEGTR